MYIALTSDQIKDIHDDLALEDYGGGLEGIKDPGYLELIAGKPFTDYYCEEQYPGLFLKAAVYMHGLVTAHAFFDANKRTAVLCAITFLDVNGYELDSDWEELFDVTIAVATHLMDLYQLADWLEANSIKNT